MRAIVERNFLLMLQTPLILSESVPNRAREKKKKKKNRLQWRRQFKI